jgi:3-methyl-2-oxobutanoate hydroxymethyltransferase
MSSQPGKEKGFDKGLNKASKQTRKKVTVLTIQKKKERRDPITMLTAYDYSSAQLVDAAGIDMILVGDSLAMVMLGMDSTVSLTMDEMLHHCRAVARGAKNTFLVGDLPFMSYQADKVEAVRNAGRIIKEGNMEAVKLEGGEEMADTIAAIVRAGIPVMGHIGLTPQSVSKLGGYRVQGKTADHAGRLLKDALALERAGCFSIVLEAIPAPVAAVITEKLHVPTIGIGAGPKCDGQVLVYHDTLGLFDKFTPRFVRQYADVRQVILEALTKFSTEVTDGPFPAKEHTFDIGDNELQAFMKKV